MKAKPKKAEGMYPDADPTAPGGMSRANLRIELAEVHGVGMDATRTTSWPDLIQMVADGRLAREAGVKLKRPAKPNLRPAEDAFEDEPVSDQSDTGVTLTDVYVAEIDAADDDFDALMADLEEVADDEPAPPVCAVCDSKGEHSDTDHRFIDARYYEPDSEVGDPEDTDPEVVMADLERAQAALAQAVDDRDTYAESIQSAPLFIGIPHTRDYIFDGHKGTGPSAAERWMSCTASLGASRAFLETLTPNQQVEFAGGSMAARQGTTAHAVAEVQARVLLGEMDAEEADLALMELAVHPPDGEDYDDEMERYVAEYTDLVESYIEERGSENVLIEQRVTATIPLLSANSLDGHRFISGGDDSTFGKRGTWCAVWLDDDQCGRGPDEHSEEDVYDITGSLDLGVMPLPPKVGQKKPAKFQRLVVGDLKYGEGIDVDVDSNPQIRIYALGLLADIIERFDGLPDWLTDVDYIIAQPRLGGIKTWTEKVDDLLAWQEDVLSIALTEALGGQRAGAKFSPSDDACQWCPARGGCPALLAQRQENAAELFDVMIENDGDGFPETGTLSDADLSKFYTQVRGLTSLAAELKEELQRRAYRGNAIPGYALVNYQPPRHWAEGAEEQIKYEGALDGMHHDKVFKTTLVTPTQAEKLLGEAYAQVESLVVKPDKRPVIAPEGDRRSKWTGLPPESMFEIEED